MNSERWIYPRSVVDLPGPIDLPGAPLQLYERGIWDPAEQYWGEPEDSIAASIAQVIAGGPRIELGAGPLEGFMRVRGWRRGRSVMRGRGGVLGRGGRSSTGRSRRC